MNVPSASIATSMRPDVGGERDRQLRGGWLICGRLLWLVIVVPSYALFVANVPAYFASLHLLRAPNMQTFSVQLIPGDVQALQSMGLSVDFYAMGMVVVSLLFQFSYALVGILIFWRRSEYTIALLTSFSLMMLPFGFAYLTLQALPSTWSWSIPFLNSLGNASVLLCAYVIPDGRFAPRWIRWVALVMLGYWIAVALVPSWELGRSLPSLVLFCGFCIGAVLVQVYRYRHVSTPRQRQQTKWLIFGISIAVASNIAARLLYYFVLLPLLGGSPLAAALELTLIMLSLLVIPATFGIALFFSHLWDIDIIINRTLVYGALTASAVGIYVLVVGGLGELLQVRGNLVLSLLATGLIAVLIQPLHSRLQRAVNHLLYGERDEPYKVISRLGQRLEATLAPEAVLPTIVETVTGALKLPYAAISLKQDGEDVIAASSGRAADELTRLPLVYQREHLGELLLAPRARGETFSSADRALLADLAHQAGIAVHAVRLTTDLQRLTQELQSSRTALVTAREEERRRLRRDLHDGLGSVLASLNWRAGALRLVLSRDPVAADALVVEQQNTIQAAIGDIRRLVYELRPPALDELGLLGAIREQAAKQSAPTGRDSALGLHVDVVASDHLPALPAAVEVAAYRIVQEALANVVRHAQAHRCCICLSCENDLLHVEVTDDGIGLPESSRAGVGLLSMRERAAELGGTCEIALMPEGGTCVRACLPLLKHDQQM
jgi:signal transduction histidine kinase